MSFPTTRLRRLRSTEALRELVTETRLHPKQFLWPLFVVPGKDVKEPISSMPGQFRYSVDRLVAVAKEAEAKGLGGMILFGVPDQKDEKATTAIRKDSLVAQAVQAIKEVRPRLAVATDVCLCAYLSHGHCGLVGKNGKILNDESLEVLSAMALTHAQAGADLVAPSDMMDGRIGVIRKTLDAAGFTDTPIMSYSAKYASSFYGPFREAAHSQPEFGDRKSYQMNPANVEEALREMALDAEEGADILMVKPALPYLDVLAKAKQKFLLPLAAYQVSGEYAMIKAAARDGWLDEKTAVLESLTAIRRAGADIILSYFALDILDYLAS